MEKLNHLEFPPDFLYDGSTGLRNYADSLDDTYSNKFHSGIMVSGSEC